MARAEQLRKQLEEQGMIQVKEDDDGEAKPKKKPLYSNKKKKQQVVTEEEEEKPEEEEEKVEEEESDEGLDDWDKLDAENLQLGDGKVVKVKAAEDEESDED